ncbi:MAG: alpha/beta fold hydrolase [Bryobacteraceae bacterium]
MAHPAGRIFTRTWRPAAECSSPIVLFHDSLGCVELWRDFPEALAARTGRCVVAYDRLGFGKSDARRGRPGLDFVGEEAAVYFPALREQLGIGRFVAFGHSVGGGMAVHCAARFASECDAVITESAQAFVEPRTVEGIAAVRDQFLQPGQMARLEKYHGGKAAWVLDAWTGTWLDAAFASWSLDAVLPAVGRPLLAIHGDRDEYGSLEQPARIAALAGGPSRVEVMTETAHVPHREREEAVVRLVTSFLESV